MKYFLSLFIAIILVQACTYAEKLEFEPAGGGKFIYSNNPEAITEAVLANGENPCYIMSNENYGQGNYYLYLSHFNHTGNGGMGYDIELDTEIAALEDTVITISNLQFSTNRALKYTDENGNLKSYENDWGFLDVCAGMLGVPIITRDGSDIYRGQNFKPVTVSIKSGETLWLSEYIENYKTTLFCMPVHMQASLEIVSGRADINVAAFKHNGKLGDRSYFDREKTGFGIYRRDRCLKGVADSLPQVTAKLAYTVDNETEDGTLLPVIITNQYATDPVETTRWCTNLNPQDDIWSKYITAENDMLTLKYKDASKLTYYGSNSENKSDIWIFDTRHSDTRHFDSAFGISPEDYEPNFVLDVTKDNQGMGCSMGNYGVTTTYRLEIENKSDEEKWFEYKSTTASNIIAYISDENGEFSYAAAKKLSLPAAEEYLVSQRLEPGRTTVFNLNVILPVNYNGGLQNSFVINSERHSPDYENMKIKEKQLFDDKVYFKSILSSVPEKTPEKLVSNPESYEIVSSDGITVARWCAWDGLINYYASSHDFAKEVFTFDKDFNVISTGKFSGVLLTLEEKNGVFYIQTSDGKSFASDGTEWWEIDFIPEEKNFSFYNISDWARGDIAKMFSRSRMTDVIEESDAAAPCTRADFCRIVYPLIKGKAEPASGAFSDTEDIACLTLGGAGIVLGMGDGVFAPDRKISRQEAAVILARTAEFFGTAPGGVSVTYEDSESIAEWAKDSVSAVTGLGIMIGTGEGCFSPLDEYTVQQALVTVFRLSELVCEK